jgi:V8-like Glu-specific endopeptidase
MLQYPHNVIGVITAKDSKGGIIQGTAAMVSSNMIITSSHIISNKEAIEFKYYQASNNFINSSEGIELIRANHQ